MLSSRAVKAVILARGKGTRMRQPDAAAPLGAAQDAMAAAGLKAMIPIRGRPFLDYVLSALADADCLDVCLVVGPEHSVVREHYTKTRRPERVRVQFAVQARARGTADAVLAAERFAGRDPFLVLNADNYYPVDVYRALGALDGPGLAAFRRDALVRLGTIDPERVRSFALLRLTPAGDLEDIVEKPDEGTLAAAGESAYVSMNCWRFGPSIFEACRRVAPSPRGELELPEAVRYAVRRMGERYRAIPFEAGVLDLSRRGDVAEVAQRLPRLQP
jgi:glucose-1-phosphate thymidylyltransferase